MFGPAHERHGGMVDGARDSAGANKAMGVTLPWEDALSPPLQRIVGEGAGGVRRRVWMKPSPGW